MSAYKVSNDEHSTIVFADRNVVARRVGAEELNTEFEFVSCERAPEFDRWAEMGFVPPLELIKVGWWFYCRNCARRVSEEDADCADPPFDPIEVGEAIYCTPACKADKEADDSRVIERHEELLEIVRREFPDAEVREHSKPPSLTSILEVTGDPAFTVRRDHVGEAAEQKVQVFCARDDKERVEALVRGKLKEASP